MRPATLASMQVRRKARTCRTATRRTWPAETLHPTPHRCSSVAASSISAFNQHKSCRHTVVPDPLRAAQAKSPPAKLTRRPLSSTAQAASPVEIHRNLVMPYQPHPNHRQRALWQRAKTRPRQTRRLPRRVGRRTKAKWARARRKSVAVSWWRSEWRRTSAVLSHCRSWIPGSRRRGLEGSVPFGSRCCLAWTAVATPAQPPHLDPLMTWTCTPGHIIPFDYSRSKIGNSNSK
jgi:hypothetical protein